MYARFETAKAMDFLRVQLDTNFRKQWDTSATELKIIEENKDTNSDLVYWEMRWPVTLFLCFVFLKIKYPVLKRNRNDFSEAVCKS